MRLIIFFMLCSSMIFSQDDLDKTYDSNGIHHVIIDNFKGDINVMAGKSNQIVIKATYTNNDKTEIFNLKEYREENVLAVYLDNPCKNGYKQFDPENPFQFLKSENNCNWGEGLEEVELPEIVFEIEIPADMNIYLSTILDGDIKVNGIKGTVYASNVTGSIVMNDVSNVKNGTTINGNIDINYNKKPGVNGRFSSINGDISLIAPSNSSIKTNFKSFQGELYTDFDAILINSNAKSKEQLKPGEMIKFNEYSEAQIGSGEIALYIETFNGNAYLKKI